MTIFTSQNAIDRARKIFLERYSGAEFCIAAGSIVSGKGTVRSDLDLVVVFQSRECAFRESFTFDEMPVEVFVHDYETIQAFIEEDYGDAHASIMDMIAYGVSVPEETDASRKLKKYASKLLNKGPEPLTRDKEEALRYFISDLIDDLKGDRSAAEQRAILYKLYPQVGELVLRRAGKFVSTGKRLARSMGESFPHILNVFEDVMLAAHADTISVAHIEELENMVDDFGGLLFDGYKRDAPKEKRSTPVWLQE